MAKDRKTKGEPKDGPPRRRKTLVIRDDLLKRLETAAVQEGVDESTIVEQLIEDRLSGYVISVRGTPIVLSKDRRTPTGDVNNPADAAA